MELMIFGIDFDGTVVTHEFPDVGTEVPGAADVLRELVAAGHQLILWTMRSDGRPEGDFLAPAVDWFAERGIPLLGVNRNPTQYRWTGSPKAYAHCYIDDAALGCPLIHPDDGKSRPYVDWNLVREYLVGLGAIKDLA